MGDKSPKNKQKQKKQHEKELTDKHNRQVANMNRNQHRDEHNQQPVTQAGGERKAS